MFKHIEIECMYKHFTIFVTVCLCANVLACVCFEFIHVSVYACKHMELFVCVCIYVLSVYMLPVCICINVCVYFGAHYDSNFGLQAIKGRKKISIK